MIQTELPTKHTKIENSEQVAVETELRDFTGQELPLARELGAKVCASVQELWELYSARRYGSTIHVGRRIVEVEGVAMRDYGRRQHEETIVRSRVYYDGNKSDFGPSEMLSVHIKTDDGEELITVDAAGDAVVQYSENAYPEDWLPMSFERAEGTVDELSHRAVIAAMRHGARTEEEKAVANAHAKALLHQRFPLFARTETSLE